MRWFLLTMLPYLAAAVFLLGMLWRTWNWLRRPVPFPLPLDPANQSLGGRAAVLGSELGLFRSLFRADRALWLWAWLMHASLLLILIGHVLGIATLTRQFTWIGCSAETSSRLSRVLGTGLGVVFIVAVLMLLYRRVSIPEVKRLSRVAEYFDLTLLLAVAVSGLALRWAVSDFDLLTIRSYLGDLLAIRPSVSVVQPLFLLHFTLFNLLLLYFPASKLVHLTGAIICRGLLVASPPAYPSAPDAKPRGWVLASGIDRQARTAAVLLSSDSPSRGGDASR